MTAPELRRHAPVRNWKSLLIQAYSSSAAQYWSRLLLWAALLVYSALLVKHHLQLILEVLPLDIFEPAMLLITGLIMEGGNPYRAEYLPIYTNVYPALYNVLVAPLAGVFGNTLALHRAVNAGMLLISCGLCYQSLRHLGVDKLYALCAGAMLYAALLHYSTPIASVNGLGHCLFMACLLVPLLAGFSRRSLIFSAVFGVLAFFGKQYFIAAPAFLSVYLLWRVSLLSAVVYSLLVLLLLAASVGVTLLIAPYYLDTTFFAPQVATIFSRDENHLIKQLLDFLTVYASLILAILLAGTAALRVPAANGAIPARGLEYFTFMLLGGTLAVVLVLGYNLGNYLTYLFQLMSPFLLLASFLLFHRSQRMLPLLLPLLFMGFWQTWSLLPTHTSPERTTWEVLEVEIERHEHIFADALVVHLVSAQGKTLYQGALTQYFHFSVFKPAALGREVQAPSVRSISTRYIRETNEMIGRKFFDLVLLRPGGWGIIGAPPTGWPYEKGPGQAEFLKNYEKVNTLQLPYPERLGGGMKKIDLWKPRRS